MYAHLPTSTNFQSKRGLLLSILGDLSIVLLFASAGCGMMRKVERERSEATQHSLQGVFSDSLNIRQQHNAKRFQLQQSDSSVGAYVLEIWPKGQFSFRNGEGFVGEAEKVRIKGRNLSVMKSMLTGDSSQTETKLEQQRHGEQSWESSTSSKLMLRKNPAWKWALLVLAAAIGLDLAYYFYKKKKATHR
jgi:hypothetical protein